MARVVYESILLLTLLSVVAAIVIPDNSLSFLQVNSEIGMHPFSCGGSEGDFAMIGNQNLNGADSSASAKMVGNYLPAAFGTSSSWSKVLDWEKSMGVDQKYHLIETKKPFSEVSRYVVFSLKTCSHLSEGPEDDVLPTYGIDRAMGDLALYKSAILKSDVIGVGGKGVAKVFDESKACKTSRPFERVFGSCLSEDGKVSLVTSYTSGTSVPFNEYLSPTKMFELAGVITPEEDSGNSMGGNGQHIHNLEGAFHMVVMQILSGMEFLHTIKKIALRNFQNKIILVHGKKMIIGGEFTDACEYEKRSGFACLADSSTDYLYEGGEYYGSDADFASYTAMSAVDVFLFGIQFVLPGLTGDVMTPEAICKEGPVEETATVLAEYSKAGYTVPKSKCARFVNDIFGFFAAKAAGKSSVQCDVTVMTILNYKSWHTDQSTYKNGDEDPRPTINSFLTTLEGSLLNVPTKDDGLRKTAYTNLFRELHIMTNPHVDPDADAQAFQTFAIPCQRTLQDAELIEERSTDSVAGAKSLFELLASNQFTGHDLNGKKVPTTDGVHCLIMMKRWLACKWTHFLLDTLQCPVIRPTATELMLRLGSHYVTDCSEVMKKPTPCETAELYEKRFTPATDVDKHPGVDGNDVTIEACTDVTISAGLIWDGTTPSPVTSGCAGCKLYDGSKTAIEAMTPVIVP